MRTMDNGPRPRDTGGAELDWQAITEQVGQNMAAVGATPLGEGELPNASVIRIFVGGYQNRYLDYKFTSLLNPHEKGEVEQQLGGKGNDWDWIWN